MRGATSAPPRRSRRRRREAHTSSASRCWTIAFEPIGSRRGQASSTTTSTPQPASSSAAVCPTGPFPTTTTCGIYRDHMTIAITGASGTLGRLIASQLPNAVLLTRDPSAVEGADVREADFEDPASVERALAGVDRLLIISTARGRAARRALRRGRRRRRGRGRAPPLHLDHRPVGLQPRRRRRAPRHGGGDARERARVDVPAQLDLHRDAGPTAQGALRRQARHERGRRRHVLRLPRRLRGGGGRGSHRRRARGQGVRHHRAGGDRCRRPGRAVQRAGRPARDGHAPRRRRLGAAMVEHAGVPEAAARVYSTFGKARGWGTPTASRRRSRTSPAARRAPSARCSRGSWASRGPDPRSGRPSRPSRSRGRPCRRARPSRA